MTRTRKGGEKMGGEIEQREEVGRRPKGALWRQTERKERFFQDVERGGGRGGQQEAGGGKCEK